MIRDEIVKNISSNTKAILGVHLYGQLYNVTKLEAIAKSYNLLLIEDAAQAHGAVYKDGRKSGNVSNAGAFSFYPTKNLGALGDAGAVTTNNRYLFELINTLKNYGRISAYENEYKGYNCRLDEIQAAFLNVKLKRLDADNLKRQEIAAFYLKAIKNSKIKLPFFSKEKDHVFHQFVIQVAHRETFVAYMNDHEIEVSVHYPIPPHKQKALREYNKLVLPVTERIHEGVVSLPINPILTQQEIYTIVEVINRY
ncbi:DegT/DnrJ/EryC1/StrS family aminotransferase [Lacinutrix neustonica]|uniref:DegT/DnrJ/EryC1/StrS family aminotransferase n=1 Tax=Lacinutrix neustonica TaxID=2980107 RepID=UPI0028BE368F|nr:DegT/DnrJ/EryC1/StrS family aminotransferase [Lacinutrix neustonica]